MPQRTSQQVSIVLPFPVSPEATAREVEDDGVPRWCVRRYPAIGSDAVTIIGYDGEGYPVYDVRCKVGRVDRAERMVAQLLDETRADQGLHPLRRSVLTFPRVPR